MPKQRDFFRDSGSLALDLLNTGMRSGGRPAEQLRSPADLLQWIAPWAESAPPSVEAAYDLPSARILLDEARHLRDDIGRLVEAVTANTELPSHVLYGINRVLRASPLSTELAVAEGSVWLVAREQGSSLLCLLAPPARAAAELYMSTAPSRVRRCSSETCERWFVDTSKGGRRKWCSMSTCGNRAKAASHRRRSTLA